MPSANTPQRSYRPTALRPLQGNRPMPRPRRLPTVRACPEGTALLACAHPRPLTGHRDRFLMALMQHVCLGLADSAEDLAVVSPFSLREPCVPMVVGDLVLPTAARALRQPCEPYRMMGSQERDGPKDEEPQDRTLAWLWCRCDAGQPHRAPRPTRPQQRARRWPRSHGQHSAAARTAP
jgi:hypothetical protein